jgi:hypothetical protein
MPWEARYLAAERLVESSDSGHVAPAEPWEGASSTVRLAMRSRGWNVRIFGDRDRARAWLTEP